MLRFSSIWICKTRQTRVHTAARMQHIPNRSVFSHQTPAPSTSTSAGHAKLLDFALQSQHERLYGVHRKEADVSAKPSLRGVKQSSDTVLMIAPTEFEHNADAAVDNKFMVSDVPMSQEEIVSKAISQFNSAAQTLKDKGVKVIVKLPNDKLRTPDAVFPNNWFSTHTPAEVSAETLVLYPMKVPNRRLERRPNIIAELRKQYPCVLDLSTYENRNLFLEGTGSLVLDRVNRIAYALLSERTHKPMVELWADYMKYRPIMFEAFDANKNPIYHTNVMMFIGTELAIVCDESIPDGTQRKNVLDWLNKHHSIMTISQSQVRALCGNVIEVHNGEEPILVMSARAFKAFDERQKRQIASHYRETVVVEVDLIETIGGGGIRCMIAELF